ncbi:MAG: 23S rRNA (adenine(2503)-C(2))-methyltransferase RlmN [bacterium]|nr:23S rRNA (adenine(2503)-C(2))-methyltransferase RlmN [bacterium]
MMVHKIDIKNLDLPALTKWVTQYGQKPYRAKQLFKWIYQHRVESFEEMTDIAVSFRHQLSTIAEISQLQLQTKQISADGTRKYLFTLSDNNSIESVLIPDNDRLTVCISTQVGCALNCAFCLTGKSGFIRNLTSAEIVNQVLAVDTDAKSLRTETRQRSRLIPQNATRVVTNIVLMGMGEPLLNFTNVVRAIRILSAPEGYNFSPKHITVSTVGIIPKLYALAKENTNVNLAISLNATTDEQRNYLMPIHKKTSIEQLFQAIRAYPLPKRRRITFEYVLIAGINDSLADAHRLGKLLQGIRCKINLIPFNEIPGCEFKRPSAETVLRFQQALVDQNYTVLIRESRGQDIFAACGQLRAKGQRSINEGQPSC